MIARTAIRIVTGGSSLTTGATTRMRSKLLTVVLLSVPGLVGADGQRDDSRTTNAGPILTVVSSMQSNDTANQLWIDGTSTAIGEKAAREAAAKTIPVSEPAAAWHRVLENALPQINQQASALSRTFDLDEIAATVVVGNRASSDAFAWVPNHIGINVSAFADTYGPPDAGAQDRMARIVLHEYLHLLTYAHYENHREMRQTPIDRALWTIFFEGIGDYVSMSERWLPDSNGNLSMTAATALAQLEPELTSRLERFLNIANADERNLRSGIAMGRFDQKWGSLPYALWLRRETAQCGESETLRAVFSRERGSVVLLAIRHADPALRPRLTRVFEQWENSPSRIPSMISECIKDH